MTQRVQASSPVQAVRQAHRLRKLVNIGRHQLEAMQQDYDPGRVHKRPQAFYKKNDTRAKPLLNCTLYSRP